MISSNATKMDVELDYGGDLTPEQLMEIDAEKVSETFDNGDTGRIRKSATEI